MEEGEIYSNDYVSPHPGYRRDPTSDGAVVQAEAASSPLLERPGDSEPSTLQPLDDDSPQPAADNGYGQYTSHSVQPTVRSGCLRLLVQQSPVLPKKQSIAVVDGYTEIQIGRDVAPPGSDTPRIRIKEMAVSKFHATIYWDMELREWAVVDMGSKHGTFLLSDLGSSVTDRTSGEGSGPTEPGSSHSRGVRLSPPKVASIPRRLRHLDALSIGDTTFIVHIHDRIPCADCSPKGNDEIPLFDPRRTDRLDEASKKRKRDEASVNNSLVAPVARDPKKALTMLKRSLLSHHDAPPAKAESARYIDRSARRRSLYPSTPPDAPGVASRNSLTPSASLSLSLSDAPAPKPEPVSAPPTPISDSNIGHRLLMKQGWQPGTGLGQPDSGGKSLVEPLHVNVTVGRAGLGMSSAPASVPGSPRLALDWKEGGKMRRWASVTSEETDAR
ncbi:hypothetical protein OBBRIDRAFT_788364 [Obba rivulosa]|uniref:Angiogenic factor with G patch and FHA domains 1 n=1 Tax=Obba rivulosa TaxID=1052685 RepID=A0A8E2J684_9APHY|nr:hypothetical protein OBBRIDRAFT_788364 [Obba rivulosa]